MSGDQTFRSVFDRRILTRSGAYILGHTGVTRRYLAAMRGELLWVAEMRVDLQLGSIF